MYTIDIEQSPEEDEINGSEDILYVQQQLLNALIKAQSEGVETVVDLENNLVGNTHEVPIAAYIQQCKEYIQEVQENPENFDW